MAAGCAKVYREKADREAYWNECRHLPNAAASEGQRSRRSRKGTGRPRRLTPLPTRSWIMKRRTRVPASTVVKMNSASNRMAKLWIRRLGAASVAY
jgi:hypothetical protein